jgi:membrane protein
MSFAKKILQSKPVRAISSLTKKIVLPGFDGIDLYDVSKFFFRGIKHGALVTRASSLAFFFFLAIFPSIIFFFTLIPYVPIADFQVKLFELLRGIIPEAAFTEVQGTITDIISRPNGGLLSFGFILALYFSTNGFNAMIGAFNSTYHAVETRNWLTQRLVSVLLVIITTSLIIVAISILVASEYFFSNMFEHRGVTYHLLNMGKWLTLFFLFFISVSFIYYLGPSKKNKWKFLSAGSTLATILSIIASIGFAYYVNNFGSYNKLYGSIGTLIVIMMWIYFNSLILLLGFELNASIRDAKKGREINFEVLDDKIN